mmetsp:Transcript_113284/g.316532  ORF Transcript_113284/g.316532 Transcript_113284/m.316532 type:complete len:201 (+) Transcript_113284:1234-1836(+)
MGRLGWRRRRACPSLVAASARRRRCSRAPRSASPWRGACLTSRVSGTPSCRESPRWRRASPATWPACAPRSTWRTSRGESRPLPRCCRRLAPRCSRRASCRSSPSCAPCAPRSCRRHASPSSSRRRVLRSTTAPWESSWKLSRSGAWSPHPRTSRLARASSTSSFPGAAHRPSAGPSPPSATDGFPPSVRRARPSTPWRS